MRRLLSAALVLALTAPVGAAKFEGRLPTAVVPTSQTVELRTDPREIEYSGSTTLELDVREPVSGFLFHAERMTLGTLSLTREGEAIETSFELVADDVVRVSTPTELAPGPHRLEIAFTNTFGTQAVGLYRMDQGEDGYAFTQFEADDAREAFPCWDEPSFKIPFRITISHPEELAAVSNTPVVRESVEDGWRTTVYSKTKPLPTYLLAMAVGPFETVELPGIGVPGKIYVPRGQAGLTGTAAEMTAPILAALERYFDGPYPFEKLDFIAVPEYWPGAMEHPGAVTYKDAVLLIDPKAASVGQRRTLARIIAHELAHQWFGNLVTMEWWDDLWLNESFADWMGDRIADEVFPELRIGVTELEGTQRVLAGDGQPSARPIRRPVISTESLMQDVGIAYYKGKLVLSMFEGWMGEEAFRDGVNSYLEENAWGNAQAADLWRALDEASGKNVSGAMMGFLEQPGYPLLTAEVLPGNVLRLSQERYRTAGVELEELTWKLPVVVKYSDGGTLRSHRVLLEGTSREFELPAEEEVAWAHPNGGAGGYYRWRLPPAQMRELARSSDRLDGRESIEFLGNAAALLSAGVIGGGDYLRSLVAFSSSAEPLVVNALYTGLGTVEGTFVTGEVSDEFAAYTRRVLRPAFDRHGMTSREGEAEAVSIMRPRLLDALGIWGRDPEVLARSRELAESYLEDPTSIDPSVASTVLSLAAVEGDETLFEEYHVRFETAEVPADRSRFLRALGHFEDPALRERALRYVLEGPLRPNELFTIPRVHLATEAHRDLVVDWLFDNYDVIAAQLRPEARAFLPFVARGCSRERLERVREFFSEPDRLSPSTRISIDRTADSVEACASLNDREGDAVRAFLTGAPDEGDLRSH